MEKQGEIQMSKTDAQTRLKQAMATVQRTELLAAGEYVFEIREAAIGRLKNSRERCLVMALIIDDVTILDYVTIANWRDQKAQEKSENKLAGLLRCTGVKLEAVVDEKGEWHPEALVGASGEVELSLGIS